MSASQGDQERIRRSRYQAIDFRTSRIADESLHVPSHGQDQTPDQILGRDNYLRRLAGEEDYAGIFEAAVSP